MKFICLQNEHNAIFLFSRELVSRQKSIGTGRDFLPLLLLWGNQNILQNKQNNPTNYHIQNKCRKCSSYKKQSGRLPQPPQFSPGLLVNFFQNFLPILFKKVNFCFFRIFWFFQRFAKDLGRKSWRKINWLWLWQNFHLKFFPVTFSAEFVSSTCHSRGDCFGVNLQVFGCCCNAGINLVKILRSDVNRSGVLILGLWFFFPRSCYGGFIKNWEQEKNLSIY